MSFTDSLDSTGSSSMLATVFYSTTAKGRLCDANIHSSSSSTAITATATI